MAKIISNFLRMVSGTIDYLVLNKVITDLIPAFEAVITELKAKSQEMVDLIAGRGERASGKAESKEDIETTLENLLFRLTRALFSYASAEKLLELKELTNIKIGVIQKKSDQELVTFGIARVKLAQDNIAHLAAYGVLPEHITRTQEYIAAFENINAGITSTLSTKTGATKDIRTLRAELDTFLEERVDPLVDILMEDHPEFSNGYEAVRKIKDYGIRHEKPEGEPVP